MAGRGITQAAQDDALSVAEAWGHPARRRSFPCAARGAKPLAFPFCDRDRYPKGGDYRLRKRQRVEPGAPFGAVARKKLKHFQCVNRNR